MGMVTVDYEDRNPDLEQPTLEVDLSDDIRFYDSADEAYNDLSHIAWAYQQESKQIRRQIRLLEQYLEETDRLAREAEEARAEVGEYL